MCVKRLLAFLLSLILCISFAGSMLTATADSAENNGTSVNISNPPAYENLEQATEIETERTPTSKTYLNTDGSYSYIAYAYDIHFLGKDGNYYEIDNSIIPSENKEYLYTNAANSWNVFFGENKLVVENEDKQITMFLPEPDGIFLMKDIKTNDSEYFK